MVCLRCGWCCETLWPGNQNDQLNTPVPCPNLLKIKGAPAICRIYHDRPKQCRDEHMGAEGTKPCMIGLQALDSGKIPRPLRKCMNCGSPVYSDEFSIFCSESCSKEAVAILEGL